MERFVDKTAAYILKHYSDKTDKLCVVVPNKRAGIFIKQALSQLYDKPLWSPQLYSIEEFIVELSGLELVDPIAQLFHFYSIYSAHEKEAAEPFEQFAKWAPVLLSDYNDIDSNLIDADLLFTNLKNIKELESWSLGDTGLTTFQRAYLHFWETIGVYYKQFTQQLLSEHKAYQGLAYRYAAQHIAQLIQKQNWEQILFVGFNALNTSEEKIIQALIKLNKAEIIWDANEYYTNDPLQEAGKFLRKHIKNDLYKNKRENAFLWNGNELSNTPKHVEIIGAPGNVSQARLAGELLNGLLTQSEQEQAPHKTALVMADESLLFPVMYSLPSNVKNVNITMGYPLKNTAIVGYVDLIFNLHANAKKLSKNYSFHHADIIAVFDHQYSNLFFNTDEQKSAKQLIRHIKERNIVFCNQKSLFKMATAHGLHPDNFIWTIFEQWTTIESAFQLLFKIVEELKQYYINKEAEGANHQLEIEYLFYVWKLVKRIQTLSLQYNCLTEISALRVFISELVKSTNLSFTGEPLLGLQIMGVLETRTLDFENIILTSANEGVLPAGKTQNTFIPFDVKRVFGMQTYSDKDAIFAYHFYRLLQRAKNIFLIYNTEAGTLGGGEKSRFVDQLLYEIRNHNPNITIHESIYENLNKQQQVAEITIAKNDLILEQLFKKATDGFSPSILNVYRNCSLQFYFKVIGKLREIEEVEETIGADVMGNVIHATLEKLYSPHIAKIVTVADLSDMLTLCEPILKNAFNEYYTENDISTGKNLLIYKVALKYVQTFLKNELVAIKNKSEIKILSLEQEYTHDFLINALPVRLKGKIDRIDVSNGTLRIIDYKTGNVQSGELNFKKWENLLDDLQLNKSFQLLMYAWLYAKNNKQLPSQINSGIISFRELSAGVKSVSTPLGKNLDELILQEFENVLKTIITEIVDKSIPFKQTEDKDTCEYCDFKAICSR